MHARGKSLLLQAYAKPKPKKGIIKAFLDRIFHTKDDAFIKDCLRSCRGSSFRLLTYVGDDQKMPQLTERAIANFALLVTLNENGIKNKDHQAKKQFSILCTVLEKAMQEKDHNTAWIVDKALRSAEVQCLRFKRPKRFKGLVKKIATQYGLHDRLYAKHIYQCIQAHEHDDKEFIPAACVLDIHLRRSRQYRKSMQRNGCKKEWLRGAQRGTKLIEDIVAFYKITLGQNTQLPLIKLYTQAPPREKTNLLIPTLLEY
jgi:hypothetical protein